MVAITDYICTVQIFVQPFGTFLSAGHRFPLCLNRIAYSPNLPHEPLPPSWFLLPQERSPPEHRERDCVYCGIHQGFTDDLAPSRRPQMKPQQYVRNYEISELDEG